MKISVGLTPIWVSYHPLPLKMIDLLKQHDLILLSRYIDGGSDDRIFIRVFVVSLSILL